MGKTAAKSRRTEFVSCEQQRNRPAMSDQPLCYSLYGIVYLINLLHAHFQCLASLKVFQELPCETGLSPPENIFTDRSKAVLLLWIICVFLCLVLLMLSRLFIVPLWSPTGKGLTSWLLLVMFIVFLLLST